MNVVADVLTSRGIATTVASTKDDQACAATRSSGVPAVPRRLSPRDTVSTTTSGAASTVTEVAPSATAPLWRLCRRFNGVKRQISSRPPGISNASTSNDANCAAREAAGTTAPTPCECSLTSSAMSADGPFHLQLDQAVQLKRVLHRELTRDRLNEATDHHGH